MKRFILLALIGMVTSFSFGQLNITVEGTTQISGVPFEYTSAGAKQDVNAQITNSTGANINLAIERVMINPVSSWVDNLCWGSSTDGGLTGQCYDSIQTSNPYVTPDAFTIAPGDHGIFKATIVPIDPDYGCGTYRYYFLQNGSVLLDSIDIIVCKTASVEEVEPSLAISISPNPANDYFKVKTDNAEGATLRVVDVLGNVVLKETAIGPSKTINTSNFRNGIYFVIVEAENAKPISRKVIIRK
ncbi:MAG: T9SS type A sorting domain-containing protein [Crocinitomicaceae bacterium]